MNIVKKVDNESYKQDLIKGKNSNLSLLEEFVNSPQYEEFFNKLLGSVIENYTLNILNDESPETYDKLYSMKEVNIRIRKALIGIRNNPLVRLKQLEKSIETLIDTE